MRKLIGAALVLVLGCGTTAAAQGVQTGTLAGTVFDQIDFTLHGVSVTVTSPALQGVRQAVTDSKGVYRIPLLPPGRYTVRFALTGFHTVEAVHRVDLGLVSIVNATLRVAAFAQRLDVTASVPGLVGSPQGGANIRTAETNALAVNRTVAGLAELAPGLSTNTPNDRQLAIAGGFGYDNQLMVDGVDIGDNIFGQPNFLFIEDAIEEVQVLTSGIPAAYGRFGGGVVNAITRSGGNDVHGTLRVNFYNPSWTTETPLESDRQGDLQTNVEGTFGGPMARDRVWFFGALRRQRSETPFALPETLTPITRSSTNDRWEVKLTGTAGVGHTLQGSYIQNNSIDERETVQNLSIDPRTVVRRQAPNDLWAVHYRGAVSNSLFAQIQVTQRRYGFRNNGGTETHITRSPFRTRGVAIGVPSNRFYNAPFFDSTDPEDRNNRQIAGALTWFGTLGVGSHSVKVGYENFQTTFRGGNSQSATGYVFRADYLASGGQPELDDDGHPIPLFVPGVTRVEEWNALRNARLDIRTHSVYAQDQWAAGSRVTFDLGVRAEFVDSKVSALGGPRPVKTHSIVPRLGASADLTGRGRWVVQGTYAQYVSRYSEAQFALGTRVANPALIVRMYTGPQGQGSAFGPGFDLANYTVIGGSFPTANVVFDEEIAAPLTTEYTAAIGTPLGRSGSLKVTYQRRSTGRFVEDFIDDPTATGKVDVVHDGTNFGTLDRIVYRNTSGPSREYQAVVLQANHRIASNWLVDGSWTVQLRNHGNFEGEAPNQPGLSSGFGDYPEILAAERNFPTGRLDDFQRHRVRAWTSYSIADGLADVGILYRFDSPRTFSLAAAGVPLSPTQIGRDPGYAELPGFGSQTLFFGQRGAGEFNSSHMVDLALTLAVPVLRDLRPWVKLEVFNAFNNQSLVGFDTQVVPDPLSATDEHGLPTGYLQGPQFGQATSLAHYPRAATTFSGQPLFARTFFVSAGVRF